MATLKELRERREAGQSVHDDPASIDIDEAFNRPLLKHHPRRRPRRLPTGEVSFSIQLDAAAERRARRYTLIHELRAAEWAWERNPTESGAMSLQALRLAISELELAMIREGGDA